MLAESEQKQNHQRLVSTGSRHESRAIGGPIQGSQRAADLRSPSPAQKKCRRCSEQTTAATVRGRFTTNNERPGKRFQSSLDDQQRCRLPRSIERGPLPAGARLRFLQSDLKRFFAFYGRLSRRLASAPRVGAIASSIARQPAGRNPQSCDVRRLPSRRDCAHRQLSNATPRRHCRSTPARPWQP